MIFYILFVIQKQICKEFWRGYYSVISYILIVKQNFLFFMLFGIKNVFVIFVIIKCYNLRNCIYFWYLHSTNDSNKLTWFNTRYDKKRNSTKSIWWQERHNVNRFHRSRWSTCSCSILPSTFLCSGFLSSFPVTCGIAQTDAFSFSARFQLREKWKESLWSSVIGKLSITSRKCN